MKQTRRQNIFHFASAAALFALSPKALAQDTSNDESLSYKGFMADVRSLRDVPNRADIIASLQHQIDIVADCGAKPEIIDFFRTQRIEIKANAGDAGDFDSRNPGVILNAAVQASEKPILLHELLHAYHWRVMPDRFRNSQILQFYQAAVDNNLYRAGAYVTKNVQEYFAVTGSLYLWGNVDRPPFNRDNLKSRQPDYYSWLGQLFGVVK